MSNPIQRLDMHGPAQQIGRVRQTEREEDFQQELENKEPKKQAARGEDEDSEGEHDARRDEDKACGPRLPDEAGGQIDLTA